MLARMLLYPAAAPDRRFVGLKERVVYRIELGFAIVDDGDRLFRIQERVFEGIVARARDEEAREADEVAAAVVEGHPTIFELFDDAEAARASVVEREI